jgi:hypothetical protein
LKVILLTFSEVSDYESLIYDCFSIPDHPTTVLELGNGSYAFKAYTCAEAV